MTDWRAVRSSHQAANQQSFALVGEGIPARFATVAVTDEGVLLDRRGRPIVSPIARAAIWLALEPMIGSTLSKA